MGERTQIYLKANLSKNEFICSGIEFKEFVRFLSFPIENIILLKTDYPGNAYAHCFELLEGRASIEALTKENIYNYGDFCFVDYETAGIVAQLNDGEIAELLFTAHMFRPLKFTFFEKLNNRFIYLAHDDGFYCKLFMRNGIDL